MSDESEKKLFEDGLLWIRLNPRPVATVWAAYGAAPVGSEQTLFDIVLDEVGHSDRIKVAKVLREVNPSYTLTEALALTQGLPKAVIKDMDKREAGDVVYRLESAGAKVRLR